MILLAQSEAENETTERKSGWAWLGYLLVAVVTLGTASFAVGCYVRQFGGDLSASHTRWGEFGDFLGGVLNPFFALIALFLLLLRGTAIDIKLPSSSSPNPGFAPWRAWYAAR